MRWVPDYGVAPESRDGLSQSGVKICSFFHRAIRLPRTSGHPYNTALATDL
jgi:hypothetical protein